MCRFLSRGQLVVPGARKLFLVLLKGFLEDAASLIKHSSSSLH